ncbi:DNA polymerase alpha catalytic subunit-like [Coffea eugenioides]|uniref:DNA polymerase alpha catalytic subunit-like n=1 Tax=Coffea eugenioides TaxID=49369 RepID=UPI000F61420B|nr:DNA polymerase alpha catalytic subunit-like [Coffea eugenioides]
MEKQDDGQKAEKKSKVKDDGLKKEKKNRDKTVVEVMSEARNFSEKDSELEEEDDFWMPPVEECWDNDDGGDRQGSDPELGPENDDAEGEDAGTEDDKQEAMELTKWFP